MTSFHRYLAYAVPAGFLVLAAWSAVALIRNREPSERYWTLLAALQVVLGVQVLVGGILYLIGNRHLPWLHYVYGGLFPVAVLVFAHVQSKKREGLTLVLFGICSFINFGLTGRALMTGLGIGD